MRWNKTKEDMLPHVTIHVTIHVTSKPQDLKK